MAVIQLSVFLTNQPGEFQKALDHVAETGAAVRAMSIAEASAFGILRLIVTRPEEVRASLLADQFLVKRNHMVAVQMDDHAEALRPILRLLSEAGMNIEYMYSFTGTTALSSYVALRVKDYKAVEDILQQNGIRVLNDEDIQL